MKKNLPKYQNISFKNIKLKLMHQYNFLIIGFGSSGRRYVKMLNKFKFKKKIFVFSRIKHRFNKIKKNLKEIKNKI